MFTEALDILSEDRGNENGDKQRYFRNEIAEGEILVELLVLLRTNELIAT